MQPGTYISSAGHLVLIGWVLFGGATNPEPLPFEVQQVAVISSEEFAALQPRQQPPGVDAKPVARPSGVPDMAAPPSRPETSAPPDLADTAPQQPAADPTLPERPDVAPQPRPSDRVAAQAVPPPPLPAAPDPIERPAVTPDGEEAGAERDVREATAPEEAAPEIVTEAETPAGGPTRSLRPVSRPSRPDPAPDSQDAVEAAIAAALGPPAAPSPAAPVGPPLSAGERDALRVAVSSCWNVGALSSEALQTIVVVTVDMQEDGRPMAGSIRLLSHSGGSDAAARQAFETARRAIIRCGARGFPLPAEKYAQWRQIEMTFNPEAMRIR